MNVAVVDPDGVTRSVVDASVVDAVVDADLVVAVGTEGVLALTEDVPDAPVLVVGDCPGVPCAEIDGIDRAIAQVRDDRFDTVTRPVLSIDTGDATTSAFFDVTLVTTLPAKISEFHLETGGVPVTTVRADGFVVSTPAGSLGYNRDVHGTIVDPATSALAAVPIAPFVTDPDQYVLDDTDITLTVVRDETDVTLHCDGRPVGHVDSNVPVHLTADRELTVVETERTTAFFDAP